VTDGGEDGTVDAALEQVDVVVVGGGPAGLSGAKAVARSKRSVVVVDDDRPRNATADGAHNVLGNEGIAPRELLAAGRAELAAYGGQVRSGRVTDAVALPDGGFRVDLADGTSLGARRLLVASGLQDVLPDVEGLGERWGRDVLHCPYCHGWEVRDTPVGVLATTPMAVHGTMLFSQLTADVVYFAHTGPALSAEDAEALAARGVRVVEGEVVGVEVTDDRLSGVRLASGEVVPRAALVVAPQFRARDTHLASLGLVAEDLVHAGAVLGTRIAADPTGRTSVPGVWVAGNTTDPMAQVVSSMASGLQAGAMVNADLVAEETRVLVAAARARA